MSTIKNSISMTTEYGPGTILVDRYTDDRIVIEASGCIDNDRAVISLTAEQWETIRNV